MTDRLVKECIIFNPETGISEDGTMHDGVYRPRINQPKKEQAMTREEAIELVNSTTKFWGRKNGKTGKTGKTAFVEAIERLKEPITLCDFLGWEEGQEYEWRGDIFRIQSDILQVYDKEDEMWFDSSEELNDYLRLRQAKKVEPKLKAWHVKDEYSFNCLMKELKKEGRTYCNDLTWEDVKKYEGNVVIYEHINHLTYSNLHFYNISPRTQEKFDLIEYHKEEPKYFAKIKGWEVFEDDGYYWNYGEDDKWFFIGSKYGTERTKTQWAELGIDEDNAEFELVEVE